MFGKIDVKKTNKKACTSPIYLWVSYSALLLNVFLLFGESFFIIFTTEAVEWQATTSAPSSDEDIPVINNVHGEVLVPDTIKDHKLDKNFHKPYGFRKADLCIAVMSSNRPFYLYEDVGRLLYYIEKYEPDLNYDLVLIDTATHPQEGVLKNFTERYHVDKSLFVSTFSHNKQYEGIPIIYEHALELCQDSKYMMPFEEDFRLIDTPKKGFLKLCMDIIKRSEENLIGILLRRDIGPDGAQENKSVVVNNVKYTLRCQMNREYQFNNGAAVYKVSSLNKLADKSRRGSMYELTMSSSAKRHGMYYALMELDTTCHNKNCYGTFDHVGKISSRTS